MKIVGEDKEFAVVADIYDQLGNFHYFILNLKF